MVYNLKLTFLSWEAPLACKSEASCMFIALRYSSTFWLPSWNFFLANSVTLPFIMLSLSLNRQSDPPKKHSRVTTFCRKPSLELAFCSLCSFCCCLMASLMVLWI